MLTYKVQMELMAERHTKELAAVKDERDALIVAMDSATATMDAYKGLIVAMRSQIESMVQS